MALSYPLDILADWPGWTPQFELLWRKEQSRQSNGVTRTKDFGDPLWTMTATSKSLSRRELDYWRARLDALDGGDKTFKGYPLSRCWPIAYPGGSWPTGVAFDGISAQIHSIGADNKSFSLDHLPAGFVVSIGDMLGATYAVTSNGLFRSQETVTANGSGITAEFEVRPYLPVGLAVTDVVSVKRPYCLMTLVPGSLTTPSDDSGRGKISFQAIEYR
jgi:hypothetical protein